VFYTALVTIDNFKKAFMLNIFWVLSYRITTTLLCLCSFTSFGQDNKTQITNKEIITSYFDEVINDHNLNKRGEFFPADYIWHTMDGKEVRSTQDSAHIATKRWLFTAIPDVHYTIDNIVAEGDMVAVNTTATGTAKSDMFGLPAAQKKVRYKQMFFYRLKDGKITEQWEVVDTGGLRSQLEAR
jgi:predicted ester cyclase